MGSPVCIFISLALLSRPSEPAASGNFWSFGSRSLQSLPGSFIRVHLLQINNQMEKWLLSGLVLLLSLPTSFSAPLVEKRGAVPSYVLSYGEKISSNTSQFSP